MTKTFYISDWLNWMSLCEEHDVNPHEYVDFDIYNPRQISGGDTIGYKFVGDYPEEEEEE